VCSPPVVPTRADLCLPVYSAPVGIGRARELEACAPSTQGRTAFAGRGCDAAREKTSGGGGGEGRSAKIAEGIGGVYLEAGRGGTGGQRHRERSIRLRTAWPIGQPVQARREITDNFLHFPGAKNNGQKNDSRTPHRSTRNSGRRFGPANSGFSSKSKQCQEPALATAKNEARRCDPSARRLSEHIW